MRDKPDAARKTTSHFNGVVGLTAARFVNGGLALIGRALLARILPPAALGAVVLATTMLSVTVRALSGGLGQAAQYMPGAAPSRSLGASVAAACLPLLLMFGLLSLFAGEQLSELLLPNQRQAGQLYAILLYSAPAVFIAFVIGLYAVGSGQYLVASTLAVVPILVPTLGYAAILLSGARAALVVQVLVAGNVLAAAVGLGFMLKGWRARAAPRAAEVRAIYVYGLRAAAVSTFAYFVTQAVVLLAGLYADARSIGLYAVATIYGELLTQIYGPVSVVLMSRTAGASGEQDRRATLARVCRICFTLLAPSALVLGCASIPITAVIFGASYSDASTVVLLMMPGVVLSGQQRLVENYLYGINKQTWVFVGYAVHLLTCVLAMPALVQAWGLLGLPLTYSLASACSLAILLLLAKSQLGVPAGRMWLASRAELADVMARLAVLAGRSGSRTA